MHIAIRTMVNSKCIVLHKPVLAQAGLDSAACMAWTVQTDAILMHKLTTPVRNGWAEAVHKLPSQDGNLLTMDDFGNDSDAGFVW